MLETVWSSLGKERGLKKRRDWNEFQHYLAPTHSRQVHSFSLAFKLMNPYRFPTVITLWKWFTCLPQTRTGIKSAVEAKLHLRVANIGHTSEGPKGKLGKRWKISKDFSLSRPHREQPPPPPKKKKSVTYRELIICEITNTHWHISIP